MKQESMTALVSAFARASHAAYNSGAEQIKVFYDPVARLLFTQEEYQQICRAMADGIGYFCPDFTGSREEALRWIVDRHLSPSPLGRAAFAEGALETAVRTGTRQYLILGAGYDTFAYRQPDWAQSLQIFELDRPATIADKKRRLKQGGIPIPPNVEWTAAELTDSTWSGSLQTGGRFQPDKLSLCSLLGLSYYLEERDWSRLLRQLNKLFKRGSALVFDFPDAEGGEKIRAQKQRQLAAAAGEGMPAAYSCSRMETLLEQAGFLIYELLRPEAITRRYFAPYNYKNPNHPIRAMDNVCYCLAVKRE